MTIYASSKTDTQRRAMVSTAASWLPQRGMAALNLIEVARAVDAPRGSIYHYFPGGRDQLLQEALALASKSGLRMIEKAAAKASTVQEFIQTVFDSSLQQIGHDRFTGGCPVGAAVLSSETESAVFQQQMQLAFAAWQEAIVSSFMQLGMTKKQHAIELARCMLIAYEGALVCAKGARNMQMFDSAARMAIVLADSFVPQTKKL